jgi:hypothetical protein
MATKFTAFTFFECTTVAGSRQASALHCSGTPTIHCGGFVLLLSVKVSETVIACFEANHHRESYAEENSICASSIRWTPGPPKNPNGHEYGRDSPASKTFVVATLTPTFSNVVCAVGMAELPVLTDFKTHLIFNPVILNRLLFATVKGMSNGEAAEGGPGENSGAVGQGRPQNWSIAARNPDHSTTVPNIHAIANHHRRCTGIGCGGWGGRGDCVSIDGGVVSELDFGVGGWVCGGRGDGLDFLLGRRFFTENASVFCGFFGVSATTYGRAEDIRVVPIVIAELKFRYITAADTCG